MCDERKTSKPRFATNITPIATSTFKLKVNLYPNVPRQVSREEKPALESPAAGGLAGRACSHNLFWDKLYMQRMMSVGGPLGY